jgi:hypothetical protein
VLSVGSIAPGSSCAPRDWIVAPSTWRCTLCPSREGGGVADADYPPAVAPVSSLSLEEVLEHDPLLLNSLSYKEDDELWDAESPSVSWVRSISLRFMATFFWRRS